MNRTYLANLTPLRGIAALLVVIFHANLMFRPFIPFDKPNFITAGWLWVDFFFILSGFIIYYVYGDSFQSGITLRQYLTYIKARFARVYPLHLVTLLWALVAAVIITDVSEPMHPFFASMFDPAAAIPSLLFLQAMGIYPSAPLNSPSWSLSTEWWVYMLFPVFVVIFSNLKNAGKVVAFLFITGLFLWVKYVLGPVSGPFQGGPPTLNVVADFGFFRCLAGFLLGMLVFTLYRERAGYSWLSSSLAFCLLSAGAIAAMQFNIEDILVIPVFALLILAASYNTGKVKDVLAIGVLQRLGDWSFSIYMVHVPLILIVTVLDVIRNPSAFTAFPPAAGVAPDYSAGLVYFLWLVVATLIVGYLTYTYIEVPARNYLNRKLKPAAAETAAVTG